MPFTPFHLGPGALIKAAGDGRFSFLIFAGSQVLMDIEPLVRILRGDAVLHGISHTLPGALVIALVSAAVGRPVSNVVIGLIRAHVRRISWTIAIASALVGTCSHIVLDAVMHPDMKPLWPISAMNPLLAVIPLRELHLMCIASGLLAGGILAVRAAFRTSTKARVP